jgi:dienelactone hydrolase
MNEEPPPSPTSTSIRVPVGHEQLAGDLTLPPGAKGIVVFVHGSGSSRQSPRNMFVARALERHGLATLLIDLLTPEEETIDDRSGHLRFDIALLANRVVQISDWLERLPATSHLNLGLFGASTGGGAALVAAAERPTRVRAVVSRGGRPDLAGAALTRVTTPTLLIVGALDTGVIEMNESARAQMRGSVTMRIVQGATHLFEEPGTLAHVAELAAEFFQRWLVAESTRPDVQR